MPSARQTKTAGIAVSFFVAAAAVALAMRQRSERIKRGLDDLTPADERHFHRQDRRRRIGSAVMAVLAVAIAIGSRVPHMVDGRSNRAFVWIWLGVFLLIFLLLALALVDLLATRTYARRHRRAMLRERLGLFRDAPPRHLPRNNGFPH